MEKKDDLHQVAAECPNVLGLGMQCRTIYKLDQCIVIGKFRQLTTLDLSHNRLMILPYTLTFCRSLKILNLKFNHFQRLPSFLYQMQLDLEMKINLENNDFAVYPYIYGDGSFQPMFLKHSHFSMNGALKCTPVKEARNTESLRDLALRAVVQNRIRLPLPDQEPKDKNENYSPSLTPSLYNDIMQHAAQYSSTVFSCQRNNCGNRINVNKDAMTFTIITILKMGVFTPGRLGFVPVAHDVCGQECARLVLDGIPVERLYEATKRVTVREQRYRPIT